MSYDNSLDKAVIEYIKTSKIEIELMFNWLSADGTFKKPDPPLKYPDPSSARLWFDGLEKYGRAFADRECELREIKDFE